MGQIGKLGDPARGAPLRFPKRTLSPLRRACLSLGLPVDVRPRTNLAKWLRAARLGKTGIEYLKFSGDEQARRIVESYCLLKNATERKAITIDYLVMAAGADVHHVWGVIQEQLSRTAEMQTTLLACTSAPDVTRKAIEYALTPGGHEDRKLLLRFVGAILALP